MLESVQPYIIDEMIVFRN